MILKETVEEYKDYSRKEIMDFIEADSITDAKEVSAGRTNTVVQGDSTEFVHLNEKVTYFDLSFHARNPALSSKKVQFYLHIDIESQKTYQPGYPIEKRGIYYLARYLSSQLTLITEHTDYGRLEKCYSIWICRDDIPKDMHYSISFYEIVNTKNTRGHAVKKEKYDLMTLIIIKLGEEVYNGVKEDEGYELLRFLNVLMYPHKDDFMNTVTEYIDFSENKELWKEAEHVTGLGQSVYEEGRQKGVQQGLEQGVQQGLEQGVQAFIQDNIEEQVPKERILLKLEKRFGLTMEQSELYYEKYASKADVN